MRQLEAIQGQPLYSLPAAACPRMRDIDSPLTWIYCFLTYAAIRSPEPLARDLMTYGRLILREAQRHGGMGWLEYDRVFRQQAAVESATRWSELNLSLLASTVLSARAGPSTFCTLCQEADHLPAGCALAVLQIPPALPQAWRAGPPPVLNIPSPQAWVG